jgi:hypothetical protein
MAMLRILFIDGRLPEQASREVYYRQRPSQTAFAMRLAMLIETQDEAGEFK